MGKLAGGFIDVYLLEKSRVTYQQPNERCYHIFFQLVEEGPVENLQEMCCLSTDPYDYFFISQGKVKVDSIDDNEELEFTDQETNQYTHFRKKVNLNALMKWDFALYIIVLIFTQPL